MYNIAFTYLENDAEMALIIDKNFEKNTKIKSKPLDGMDTVLAIIAIAGFTLEFAKFVIDYIIKPYMENHKSKKQQLSQNDSEKNVVASRCIIYNGKTITPLSITSKLGDRDCTPENVLEIICNEIESC